MHTVRIVGWCAGSIYNERSIFKEEPKLTRAARPTCQPYYQRISGGVAPTLKEPIEQVNTDTSFALQLKSEIQASCTGLQFGSSYINVSFVLSDIVWPRICSSNGAS